MHICVSLISRFMYLGQIDCAISLDSFDIMFIWLINLIVEINLDNNLIRSSNDNDIGLIRSGKKANLISLSTLLSSITII